MTRVGAASAGMHDLVDRAIAMSELTEEIRRAFLDARCEGVFGSLRSDRRPRG
jgi:hypothetical protein